MKLSHTFLGIAILALLSTKTAFAGGVLLLETPHDYILSRGLYQESKPCRELAKEYESLEDDLNKLYLKNEKLFVASKEWKITDFVRPVCLPDAVSITTIGRQGPTEYCHVTKEFSIMVLPSARTDVILYLRADAEFFALTHDYKKPFDNRLDWERERLKKVRKWIDSHTEK